MRPSTEGGGAAAAAAAATTTDLAGKFSLLLKELSARVTVAITKTRSIKHNAKRSGESTEQIEKILKAYESLEDSIQSLSAKSIGFWALKALNPLNSLIAVFYNAEKETWVPRHLPSSPSTFELAAYEDFYSLLNYIETYQTLVNEEHFLAYAQEVVIPKISEWTKKIITTALIPKAFKASHPAATHNELIKQFIACKSRVDITSTLANTYRAIALIKAHIEAIIRIPAAESSSCSSGDEAACSLVAAGGAGGSTPTRSPASSDSAALTLELILTPLILTSVAADKPREGHTETTTAKLKGPGPF